MGNIVVEYGSIYSRESCGFDYMYANVYGIDLYAEKPADLIVPSYEFLKEKIIEEAKEYDGITDSLCFCVEGWNLRYDRNTILYMHEQWQKNIMHVEDYNTKGEIVW